MEKFGVGKRLAFNVILNLEERILQQTFYGNYSLSLELFIFMSPKSVLNYRYVDVQMINIIAEPNVGLS